VGHEQKNGPTPFLTNLVGHEKKRLKTPDLEVLEYSGIFISNPEYQILFRKNSYSGKTRSKMN